MLRKEFRLTKRSAFNATYKIGNTHHYDGITMFCGKLKNNDIPTKFGFVVSKKIHKRAVKRNRIRRLMRESIRLNLQGIEKPTKYLSIIFVASSKLLNRNFDDINNSITKLVEKL